MRQSPQIHLESKVLQLHCLQDFIQDGDSQVRDCSHAATTVVSQCRPKGCLLPHRSNPVTQPVSQVPLTRTVLPVQGTDLRAVLGPTGLHQDPGPIRALDLADGCSVVPVRQ